MQNADNKDFINIDGIFKEKNPGLYKWLPTFFLSYLKRVVHQDEINAFIREHGHKSGFEFCASILGHFQVNVIASGTENIPRSGGAILASNHPLGGLDAMALIDQVGRVRTDLRFVVNDILLQLKNFGDLFIGVNKHGRNTQESLRNLDQLYASGALVLIFPAGLVSRRQHGLIRDLEWKKSFVVKSKQHRVPVVPVYIDGNNSPFFYNLARIRGKLGIKANIEMLYLADEMYRQKHKTITIIFGKPIPCETFDSDPNDRKWAERVKQHVYKLPAEGPDAGFVSHP